MNCVADSRVCVVLFDCSRVTPAAGVVKSHTTESSLSAAGANTPFATGSNSDSLLALNTQTKEWVKFRVPYPLGFYSRGMDGRIDNPNGGWKGRGLWANYGTHFVWHIEGGKGTKGKVVHFQVRPDPLAR